MQKMPRPHAPLPKYYPTGDDMVTVYLPDEDTFLLLDTILNSYNSGFRTAQRILEIGPGTGVVLTYCVDLYKPSEAYGIDISARAIDFTRRTLCHNLFPDMAQNSLEDLAMTHCIHLLSGSLFKPLSGSDIQFDLIVFNPPYVVAECTGLSSQLGEIDTALAGGAEGREVIDEFIRSLPQYLTSTGVCHLIAIEANNIASLISLAEQHGLKASRVFTRKLQSEVLVSLVLTKA